jgi:hypothetical protein
MATKKISALVSIGQDAIDPAADVLPIVDTGSTETKKATAAAVVGKSIGALAATWNDALTTFKARVFNVTDTASDAGSLLDDLQVGGASRWSVRKDGAATAAGFIKSTSASGGIGYATGAGGTVTQATSKSTGVTLDKICGEIVMNNASLGNKTAVAFTLTNSTIAATDVVVVSIKSGGTAGAYLVSVGAVAAGSCSITLYNAQGSGSLSEAVVLSFAVIKAVAA